MPFDMIESDFAEVIDQVALAVGNAVYNTARWHYEYGTMPLHMMTDEAVRQEIVTRCKHRYGDDVDNVFITYVSNGLGRECVVKADLDVVVVSKDDDMLSAVRNALKKMREEDAAEEENND